MRVGGHDRREGFQAAVLFQLIGHSFTGIFAGRETHRRVTRKHTWSRFSHHGSQPIITPYPQNKVGRIVFVQLVGGVCINLSGRL